jgi:hypothetical protein
MANYAVNDFVTPVGNLESVMAALETQIETIDTGKAIQLLQVLQMSDGAFQGALITVA